jgi:DNA-binding NtrC family response regulator
LPPLRARPEDIGPLTDHFLARYSQKYGLPAKHLSDGALSRLREYHWPGNVRELSHAIERALILSESDPLQADDFLLSVRGQAAGQHDLRFSSLDLDEVERRVVAFVLTKNDGNISRAAAELGITRTRLYHRIEKYGL